jgi:Tfp pilus assembly protein PilV
MKTLIPVLIMLVGVLGFMVYKDTTMKKQVEVNQLLNESIQPQRKPAADKHLPIASAQAAELP